MNIVLIGMRGAGKTTVAKLLSEKLKNPYIETDELVEKKANMTIPQIVEKYGWEYFRDIESEVIREISKKDGVVISSGGGLFTKLENVKALKQKGKFFWLQVGIDSILKRIGDDPNRPSLTGKKSRREDMDNILQERKQLYKSAADEVIDTENRSADEVAKIIIEKL